MRSPILFLLLVSVPTSAYSAVIEVPNDYATIQAAIDAAVKGDIVLVAPGTYVENIDFIGKAISVKSSGGAKVTVIDGNKLGSVVSFENSEGADSVLEGFRVINGTGSLDPLGFKIGGGIYCWGSSPLITRNIITDNISTWTGGGIYCYSSSPTITKNIIFGNKVNNEGGGICCVDNSSPTIENNSINNNIDSFVKTPLAN